MVTCKTRKWRNKTHLNKCCTFTSTGTRAPSELRGGGAGGEGGGQWTSQPKKFTQRPNSTVLKLGYKYTQITVQTNKFTILMPNKSVMIPKVERAVAWIKSVFLQKFSDFWNWRSYRPSSLNAMTRAWESLTCNVLNSYRTWTSSDNCLIKH